MLPPTQDEAISVNDDALSKGDGSVEADNSKDGDDSKESDAANTIDDDLSTDIPFAEGSGLEPLLPPTQDDASDESIDTVSSKDEDDSIEEASKDVPREDVSLNIKDASKDGNISIEDTSSGVLIDDTEEAKSKYTKEDLS